MFIGCYKKLMSVLFPLISATYINRRKKIGKEHPERFNERMGLYTHERPQGKLFWLHGASVGESISMLPLIDKLLKMDENLSVLVTTGTVTSAQIMEKRLPERAFHQFIVFDTPKFAKRLLDYYHPDTVLWFESELWPSLLDEIRQRHIPLILVNGRISDKSFRRWKIFRFASKELLACFSLCLGQSEQDKERLQILGAKKALCLGNIKYAGQPLPVEEDKLNGLKKAIGGRPVFLISSTHDNEEEQLAEYLKRLQTSVNDVLVIMVPRHPNRGKDIVDMLKAKGFTVAQRSVDEEITPLTDVYVADTIGEMGLWYKLSSVTFIGGSLVKHGGQNFIEPARDKNAVIVGPYMHNFADVTKRAIEAGALKQVDNAAAVISEAVKLLHVPGILEQQQEKAYLWTVKEAKVLDGICEAVFQELKHENA